MTSKCAPSYLLWLFWPTASLSTMQRSGLHPTTHPQWAGAPEAPNPLLTHQRSSYSCKITLKPIFIPRSTNHLANFCSRSFTLSDDAFLQEFNARYPITPSWTRVPTERDRLIPNLSTMQASIALGVSRSRCNATNRTWDLWDSRPTPKPTLPWPASDQYRYPFYCTPVPHCTLPSLKCLPLDFIFSCALANMPAHLALSLPCSALPTYTSINAASGLITSTAHPAS